MNQQTLAELLAKLSTCLRALLIPDCPALAFARRSSAHPFPAGVLGESPNPRGAVEHTVVTNTISERAHSKRFRPSNAKYLCQEHCSGAPSRYPAKSKAAMLTGTQKRPRARPPPHRSFLRLFARYRPLVAHWPGALRAVAIFLRVPIRGARGIAASHQPRGPLLRSGARLFVEARHRNDQGRHNENRRTR